jgi:hypothetical protein
MHDWIVKCCEAALMILRNADALYRSFCVDQAASQYLLGAVLGACRIDGGKLT